MEHLGEIAQPEQKRPSYSPWGQIDHIERYAEGVFQVSTPGHGGLMIRKSVGNKLLSLPFWNQCFCDFCCWYCKTTNSQVFSLDFSTQHRKTEK